MQNVVAEQNVAYQLNRIKWKMIFDNARWKEKMKDDVQQFRVKVDNEIWYPTIQDEGWKWNMISNNVGWRSKMQGDVW